MKDVFGPPCH